MKEELIKPVPVVKDPLLDYHDMMAYIEKKYNISQYDISGKALYRKESVSIGDAICGDNSWCSTKPKDYTPLQQKAHDAFIEHQKGSPEYQNFWHLYSDDIAGNGSELYISFEPLDPTYYDVCDEKDYPKWALPLLQLIKDEFGQYSIDGDYLKVWVQW